MRLLGITLLAGCNAFYGLDDTRARDAAALPTDANAAIDEDLDGILNEDDNCPGVPNENQLNVIDPDAPGDACDPEDATRTVVYARYFFNDEADRAKFTADPAFTFHTGYVDIASSPARSYLHHVEVPNLPRNGMLAIEAGFEIFEETQGTRVGAYVDGPEEHYGWLELRPGPWILAYNVFPPPAACDMNMPRSCEEDEVLNAPARAVVQVRVDPLEVKALLAGTNFDAKRRANNVVANRMGVIAISARARLHHVIIYTQQ